MIIKIKTYQHYSCKIKKFDKLFVENIIHLFLKESGELFAFGRNNYGQLGLGDNENRNVPTLVMQDKEIQQIVCGCYHSFILKESGELFAFGWNYYGQLGLGDNKDRNIPTLVMQDKKIRQIVCG